MKKTLAMFVCLVCAVAAHSGPVKLRGVVEGYYGRPWGTEGRLSLLEFMGQNGMNVFIYGPKDDPYHHSKWREPYPEKELADFKRLLAVAKANGIDFCWAIHLGSGFRKSNEGDYADLFRKLGWMYDAGFRSFAVFFDDFGSADADFHAEVCNRVVNEFIRRREGCSDLIMCPNVYWGSGHPYQKTLGEKLDASVHIMWTGRSICSDIRAEDVRRITADFRRPPFIWWNWPVNDYCRSKVLLGRTYGLDEFDCSGFVSNPMENCEASKIALYGVAKWCMDPKGFDSAKTWEESFGKLYADREVAHAMRVFAGHNSDQGPNGHGYRREESVSAAALAARATEELKAYGRISPETEKSLSALFAEVRDASSLLLAKLPKERYDLGWELEGWLEAQKYQMQTALKALELLKADGPKAVAIVREIVEIRRKAEESAGAHRTKFAAATFANDKGWIKKPEVATKVLKPLVETMLESRLDRLHRERYGRKFDAARGFGGFSNAAKFPVPVVSLDGKYAGARRVMELNELSPGESFGIRVPEKWQTDYFHAKLGDADAVAAGAIEVSRDGRNWERLATRNHGAEMETPLDVKAGWRYARYRNVSGRAVRLKIDLFKFDIRSASSALDGLLESIAE